MPQNKTEKIRIGEPQRPGETDEETAQRFVAELNCSLTEARKMVAIHKGTYPGDFQKFDAQGRLIRRPVFQYWKDKEFMRRADEAVFGPDAAKK